MEGAIIRWKRRENKADFVSKEDGIKHATSTVIEAKPVKSKNKQSPRKLNKRTHHEPQIAIHNITNLVKYIVSQQKKKPTQTIQLNPNLHREYQKDRISGPFHPSTVRSIQRDKLVVSESQMVAKRPSLPFSQETKVIRGSNVSALVKDQSAALTLLPLNDTVQSLTLSPRQKLTPCNSRASSRQKTNKVNNSSIITKTQIDPLMHDNFAQSQHHSIEVRGWNGEIGSELDEFLDVKSNTSIIGLSHQAYIDAKKGHFSDVQDSSRRLSIQKVLPFSP